MVVADAMPYGWAVQLPARSILTWLALASLSLATFGGCPSSGGGPSIARLPSLTSPDPRAESELREAQALESAGEPDAAAARYRRFIAERSKDPLVPIAQLSLGRILLSSKQATDARALFDAVATHPDPSVAEQGRFLGGIAAASLGDHAHAVSVLEPMVGRTVDPGDTQLLLATLADSLIALERYAQAIAVLDRACRARPADARTHARQQLHQLVQERARTVDIAQLYDDLPRDGCAWPSVVRRAAIDADASDDHDEAREFLEVMREYDLPLDDALTRIAMRADRTEDADPRVIGAVLSLSGKGRRVGELALRGLMLAAGLPPSGPLPKDAPQLVFRDDGGDPKRAASAVEELATVHRAIAIIGPLDVRVAGAATAKAAELGVPIVLLTPAGALHEAVAHRAFPTPEGELSALLAQAARDGAARIAALLPQGPYGDALETALRNAAKAQHIAVVSEIPRYPLGATAFGREVEALRQQAFDVLLLADTPGAVASIAPALAAGGLWSVRPGQAAPAGGRAIRVLGVSASFDHGLARAVGRYLQGALFSVPFDAQTALGSGAAFAQAFAARYGEPADMYAAFAHDAFRALRAGVRAGGTTRPALLRELQRARPDDAASAFAGFLPSRETRSATQLLELQDAAFVPVR